MAANQESPGVVLERLVRATNNHDLDALVDCFAPEYRNETPAHPARGFVGRDQVLRNWEQIFAFIPDIEVRVVRSREDGDAVWSELEMTGVRRDGSAHRMAGVVIFGVRQGRIEWARFYLEPVEIAGPDANEAVRQQLRAASTPAGNG
jgi:ketosteroid isomerase-like protein